MGAGGLSGVRGSQGAGGYVLGADTSENMTYFGFVVARSGEALAVWSDILAATGRRKIHMSKMRAREKAVAISKLRSSGVIKICFRVEFYARVRALSSRGVPRSKSRRLVMRTVLDALINAMLKAGVWVADVVEVHVDREFQGYIDEFARRFRRARISVGGPAAELADVVAYMNAKGYSAATSL